MDLNLDSIQTPTGRPPHVWTEEEKEKLIDALKTVVVEEHKLSPAERVARDTANRVKNITNLVDHANAHECAHNPPPTEADYTRLDAALETIFNKKDSTDV